MRKLLGCCAIFLLVSCLDEERVDPAMPSTFVRYINGGHNDVARALEKTADGYVILANTTTAKAPFYDQIKLVKVDPYGSIIWTKTLPDSVSGKGVFSYRGNGISVTDTGYIISGEVIQNVGANAGKSNLLILETNAEGDPTDLTSIEFPKAPQQDPQTGNYNNVNLSGRAATKLGTGGGLLVLGSITGMAENMILAEVNTTPEPPTVEWNWTYGSGTSTILNRVFVNGNSEVVFGGTVTRNNDLTDLRLVRAVQNSQGTDFDLNYGDPDLSERANGICKTPNGYAMIGSSNVAGKTDRDILFTRFSESGAVLSTRTYPVRYPDTDIDVGLDDEGNGICTTSDNGFIMITTVLSATSGDNVLGRGEQDYYLIKVNAFGDIEWERAFGSKRADIGVSVAQADDGGYLVLGSTQLANLWTIALIKTNGLGEVE